MLAVNPDALAYTIGYWHEHADMNTMAYAHADAYLSARNLHMLTLERGTRNATRTTGQHIEQSNPGTRHLPHQARAGYQPSAGAPTPRPCTLVKPRTLPPRPSPERALLELDLGFCLGTWHVRGPAGDRVSRRCRRRG